MISVNCNAPDNVILQPAKRFYSYKDDNVRASCKKMSDIYRGPKNLRCLNDGRWLKEPVCEVPGKIHFLLNKSKQDVNEIKSIYGLTNVIKSRKVLFLLSRLDD